MEYLLRHQNRINKFKPKLGKHWCKSCDLALVGNGEKCPYCGHREHKRSKK